MQKLLDYGDQFAKESTWKDFALVKLCLCAIGVMWGMTIPKKVQKPVAFIAILVLITTYVPLMLKVFRILDNHTLREV